jgi:hypothetical protein
MQNYLLCCLPFAYPQKPVGYRRCSVQRQALTRLAKEVAALRHKLCQYALTQIYTNVESCLLHFSDTAPRADHFDQVPHTFHVALNQWEELVYHDISLSLRLWGVLAQLP